MFFNYHAYEKRMISDTIHLNYGLWFFLFRIIEYVIMANYFAKRTINLDQILHKVFYFLFFSSIIILFFLLEMYGIEFLVMEATIFFGNVSLITLSYFIVFNALIGIYLLSRRDLVYNKKTIAILVGISSLFVFFLGKRAALLSLVVPILFLFFLHKFSKKRTIFYMTVFYLSYYFIIDNIEVLFDFVTMFSNRLSEQLKLFYYYGDTNGRDFLWESAIEQYNKSPIFGYYPRLIDIESTSFFYGVHPHSYWLESLMTMGLVGSIPFFGFICFLIIKKVFHAIISECTYRFWALYLISEIVHGTFSSPLSSSSIWLATFIMAGYTCVHKKKYNETQFFRCK